MLWEKPVSIYHHNCLQAICFPPYRILKQNQEAEDEQENSSLS